MTFDTPEQGIPTAPSLPRVAFQGELGAFSELAIQQHWQSGATAVPCRTFPEALQRVLDGDVQFAVLPVENAIAGPVRVALTALDAVRDRVRTRSDLRVPIHLCLMAPDGAMLATVRQVRSHAVALAQCRIFFARHEWLVPTPHDDTAGAAQFVSTAGDRTQAAIASLAAAKRYGLSVLAENVEDAPANWTRFVVVSAR
jgi:prephenate dehydratase